MTDFQRHIAQAEPIEIKALDLLVARYPWFSAARIIRRRLTGMADVRCDVLAACRPETAAAPQPIDIEALTLVTEDDIIDRFLKIDDYRIVSDGAEADGEVRTESSHEDEEELVSEDLAEIYLAQGLNDQAIDIYRKLSLLNSEKSVYFAGLIAKIERKQNN